MNLTNELHPSNVFKFINIRKVPTNLVYLANIDAAGAPIGTGDLPDNSANTEMQDVMNLFDLD
jgi:hypothetical protein